MSRESEQFITDSQGIKHTIEDGAAKSTQKFFENGAKITEPDCRAKPSEERATILVTGEGKFKILSHLFGTLDKDLPNHPLLLLKDEQGTYFLFDRGDSIKELTDKDSVGKTLRGVSDPKMISVEFEG